MAEPEKLQQDDFTEKCKTSHSHLCPAKDLLLVQGPFHFLRFILVQYTRIFFFFYTGKGILCWPGRLREKRKGPKLLNNKTEDVRGDSGGRGGNAHKSWQSPGAALSKAESTVKS